MTKIRIVAGAAPVGPEVEKDDFTGHFVEVEVLAVEVEDLFLGVEGGGQQEEGQGEGAPQ